MSAKKWNPGRCWDCRHGRLCSQPKKCEAAGASWTWNGTGDIANDVDRATIVLPAAHGLSVYTSRIDSVDQDAINITRKSGSDLGLAFAPSWKILRPALHGLILARQLADRGLEIEAREFADKTFETYRNLYVDEMRESYVKKRDAWDELLSKERVVLVCYCVDVSRCHRTILGKDILPKCNRHHVGATFFGELAA
jgi:uncharacterized protein DUF488